MASVEIGSDESVTARNAKVTKVKRKGDRYLSFRYQPNSLPMAVTYEFNQATQYFEVVDEISWENLQVEGLHSDVNYRVYMNRVLVGTFSGSELEQGVNLTNLDWNPGQEAAKEMEQLNQSWHINSSAYRAVVRQAMKGQADQSDVDAAYDEWAGTTAALIGQMYDIVSKSTKHTRLIEVVSEDYHVFLGQEVWQWIVGAMVIAAGIGGLAVRRKRRKRRRKEQEN